MIIETSVFAVYDGKVLVPDQPVKLEAGKKYHLIIEDIPPVEPQKGSAFHTTQIWETACMSERVLARDWLTAEEDKAWEYL
jgi:predicted DNA-binding antitoxin AbrB/MazE fold protein